MSRRRQKKRAQKGEPRRPARGGGLRRLAVVLVGVGLVVTSLAAPLLLSGLTTSGPSGLRTAAIVDQLSLTFPNPTFVQTATDMLEQAGYAVDYYPGEEVTVDFYRSLPTYGYGLLILRNHSSRVSADTGMTDAAALYTYEPYVEDKYVGEQRAWGLAEGGYYEGGPMYFAVAPEFVRSSMRGEFDDTAVIVMGCDGLRTDMLAEAFVETGAESVVAWSGLVSASHTDAATECLLQHLLVDGLTIQEAVAQTMAELGPDRAYGSTLLVYPSDRR